MKRGYIFDLYEESLQVSNDIKLDGICKETRTTPKKHMKRVYRDMREIRRCNLTTTNSYVNLIVEDDTQRVKINICIREGPYRNASYRFVMEIPTNYPFVAPRIYSLEYLWHPNVNLLSGKVELPLEWSPVLNLENAAMAVQYLLLEPSDDARYILNPQANILHVTDPEGFQEYVWNLTLDSWNASADPRCPSAMALEEMDGFSSSFHAQCTNCPRRACLGHHHRITITGMSRHSPNRKSCILGEISSAIVRPGAGARDPSPSLRCSYRLGNKRRLTDLTDYTLSSNTVLDDLPTTNLHLSDISTGDIENISKRNCMEMMCISEKDDTNPEINLNTNIGFTSSHDAHHSRHPYVTQANNLNYIANLSVDTEAEMTMEI